MPEFPMKKHATTDADKALHADIAALCKRHLTPDTSERVLAVAAQVVGQVLAMQDQRKFTSEMAMQIVIENIQVGNRHALEEIQNTKGNA